jgi:hypothetical protein
MSSRSHGTDWSAKRPSHGSGALASAKLYDHTPALKDSWGGTLKKYAYLTAVTCSTRSEGNYGYADCYSGYGQFRAVTKCDEKWWPDPTVYGPWVQVGGPYTGSGAQCAIGDRAYDTTYQLRD